LAFAILAFVLGAIAAQDGHMVLLDALAWVGVGGALLAASHLP
jgi:hypothetical protein